MMKNMEYILIYYLLLPSLAFSFQPSDSVWIGSEPDRVMRTHVERQHQLRHGTPWQEFISSKGAGWTAVFDEHTGLAYSAKGPSLWVGDLETNEDVKAATRNFLSENSSLIGAKLSQFQTIETAFQPEIDSWIVRAKQSISLSSSAINDLGESLEYIDYATVWRGEVELRFRSGWLNWFGIQSIPQDLQEAYGSYLLASEAAEVALSQGPHSDSVHEDISAEITLLPVMNEGVLELKLMWLINSHTESPAGDWYSFVDAQTGELHHVYNEVRYLEGHLSANHDTRTVNDEFSVSPLPYIEDSGLETDLDGSYMTDSSDTIDFRLRGLYTTILNQQGQNALLTASGGDEVIDSSMATQAELDQYIFQNRIYDWAERYAPQVVSNWPSSRVNVNINDSCNAYFDGDLNFYRAGNDCNNTGQIADVSYHEWGHGFHYYNLLSGEYDGAMSEGISDCIAFLQTDSPYIAPFFGTNGSAIREVDSNRVYPDDIVGEVHYDGLIFAGAVWDYLNLMRTVVPEDEAYDGTVDLFVSALRSGPTIPESFDSFILADDDNSNLDDGTPNQCMLIEAFGLHGLGPNNGQGFISMSHLPLQTQSPEASSFSLEGDLLIFAENCVENDIESIEAFYSLDSGNNWLSQDLDLSGDQIVGQIPQVEEGQIVEYYLSIEDSEGGTSLTPTGGEINPFMFYVGELEEIFCTDFESDEGGFTHSLLAGEDQEGADDWMWGAPIGLGGDPDFAYSGTKVWGNDLGGGNYNGTYQSDKWNRLSSPVFDVTGYDTVLLHFQRWLNVEDGYYDQSQVTANGAVVWSNHISSQNSGDEHHEDVQWAPHTIVVPMNGESSIEFGWEIISDQGLELGGWTIDDVCVYGIPQSESETDSKPSVDGKDESLQAGGCSCSSTSSMSHSWALALGLLGLGFVRRRQ